MTGCAIGLVGLTGLWPVSVRAVPRLLPSARRSYHWNARRDGRDSLRASVPDSLLTITTDTGALAPGRREFAHYQNPGVCRAAAANVRDVLRRSIAAQTWLADIRTTDLTHDTLPTQVRVVARECGARFTAQGVSSEDLPILFDLALFEQNTATAYAVVERLFTMAPTASARNAVLLRAIAWYLAAEPARVAEAKLLVGRIDAQGQSAQLTRALAHTALLDFAAKTYDRNDMQREADSVIAISRGVPNASERADSIKVLMMHAYSELLAVAMVNTPTALQGIAQSASHDLSRFPPTPDRPFAFDTASVNDVLNYLTPNEIGGGLVASVSSTRVPLHPLDASWWFPEKPTRWPPATKGVTVVVSGGYCFDGEYRIFDFERNQTDCPMLWKVPEWITRYHDTNISIILAFPTWGSALRSNVLSGEQEAQAYRWYVQQYLKLPVTVAVIPHPVRQMPAPDRRRFVCTTPGEMGNYDICADSTQTAQEYLTGTGWVALNNPLVRVLAPDGRLLFQGGYSPLLDALLDHELLRENR